MNWYTREEIEENRRDELDKLLELRRQTTGRRRPVHFWLLAMLRSWIISPTR